LRSRPDDEEERLRDRLKRRQEGRRQQQDRNPDIRRYDPHPRQHHRDSFNYEPHYPRGGGRELRSRSRSRSSNDSRSSRSFSSYSSRSSRSSSVSSSDSSTSAAAAAAAPLTKDQRTVFVSQLVMRANERDIKKYFQAHSLKINDIIMLRDKRTGRHKGCAYVELRDLSDVPKAVLLSNVAPDFQKFPLLIKASEAEKNYVAAAPAPLLLTTPTPSGAPKAQKVYLGNLDPRVTQDQLYTLFSTFGPLESVQLQVDTATGVSRGFCFLGFHDARDANLAIQTMAGQLLAGRPMKTGWATAAAGVVTSTEFPTNASLKIQDATKALAVLTGAGLSAAPNPSAIGNVETPTCTILVHNMFDKDQETEPGWEEDVRLDFEEECAKFGTIVKVVVMSKEPGGKIYTEFSNAEEAKKCASNLAGRWFDKRQLRVEFVENI
jgi:RNA-binding protein 23/39